MSAGIKPSISAKAARELLSQFAKHPLGQEALQSVLTEYRDQTYRQMMAAHDDQLAGFRGMLLAIENMLLAVHSDELQRAIEKAKTRDE